MRKIYIIEQRPKEGITSDQIELTLFLNEREALKHYDKLRRDNDFSIRFIERRSGGKLLYQSMNG